MGSQEHPSEGRPQLTTHARWPLLGFLFVAIAATYLFFISAGTWSQIPSRTWFFSALADGFLDGRLSLSIQPSPELLAKPDPYDRANKPLWLWDATLHEGRYFLYWGPVPALLAAGVKLVAGRELRVGDELLVLAFVLGRLAVGMAILALALNKLFPRLHPWLVAPAVAVFGLANPNLFGLGRAAVYEAAIEGAQFFLLTGLLLGLLAIGSARSRRHQLLLSCLAGCAWAAALACRISLFLAIGGLVVSTAWISSWGAARQRREAVRRSLWIGAPVALTALALGAYNFARFGSWTDFGAAHQLGLVPYSFSLLRYLPNVHAYLLREAVTSCRFPFVYTPFDAWGLTPTWVFPHKTGYMPLEPVVGMLIAVPWVLFGGVAAWTAARLFRRSSPGAPGFAIDARDRLYLWLATACLAITLLAGVPALGMQFSTMRFLADFTSAAILTAAIGFWTLISDASSVGRRRVVHAASALLAVYTILCSLLIGFQGGYYHSFERVNPALHAHLTGRYSLCD